MVELPGANVYRLNGPSRHLIAASNVSGTVGCFESHCGHASFLIEADGKKKVRYAYSFTEDALSEISLLYSCIDLQVCAVAIPLYAANNHVQVHIIICLQCSAGHILDYCTFHAGCPRCTDSCLQHCVCTGEYGELHAKVGCLLVMKTYIALFPLRKQGLGTRLIKTLAGRFLWEYYYT